MAVSNPEHLVFCYVSPTPRHTLPFHTDLHMYNKCKYIPIKGRQEFFLQIFPTIYPRFCFLSFFLHGMIKHNRYFLKLPPFRRYHNLDHAARAVNSSKYFLRQHSLSAISKAFFLCRICETLWWKKIMFCKKIFGNSQAKQTYIPSVFVIYFISILAFVHLNILHQM
jgi:hypothetical protein